MNGKYGEGKFAIVDVDDYVELSKYTWNVNNHGYAVRNEGGRGILMHRQILNPPDDLVTDHINRIRLDNRRCNLRAVAQAENVKNRNPNKSGTSKFKGVTWDKSRRMWQVRVVNNGNVVFMEYHEDQKLAAQVYDFFAAKEFGEFVYLNFPDDRLKDYEKRKLRNNNTSGYLGVSWCKEREKWHAYIRNNEGKRLSLGRFLNKNEAAMAYNRRALDIYGEMAKLNEIHEEVGGSGCI